METIAERSYNQNSDDVFKSLLNLLNENYHIKNVDETIRCVEVSSGMSLFSFGESFEIIVANNDGGSVVRVKVKSKVRWNVTSNVEEKAEEILKSLDEKFT